MIQSVRKDDGRMLRKQSDLVTMNDSKNYCYIADLSDIAQSYCWAFFLNNSVFCLVDDYV